MDIVAALKSAVFFLLLHLFIVSPTGAAEPQAWYVRPASDCPVNGNGFQQNCADSNGRPGAFSGFDGIAWGPPYGVQAGHTLYVCGNHRTQLTIQRGGIDGSRIRISGDCPGDPGLINTVGGSAVDAGISIENWSHIEISGFRQLSGNRSAILMYAGNNPMDDISITRNVIDNRLSASATNVCNGIAADGLYDHTRVTIEYNTIRGTAVNCGGTSNSDGINLIRLTSGTIAWNDVSGSEGGIDVDGRLEGVDIYGNWSHDNRVDGLKAFGGHACPVGPLRVHQNLFINNGNWGVIWQNQKNSIFADNVVLQFHDTPQSGSAPYGGLQTEDPPLFNGEICPSSGNTYLGNILIADWQYGVAIHYSLTRSQFEKDNIWQDNLLYQVGSQTPMIWFGTPLAPTSIVTPTTYPGWQASHPGEMYGAPQFVDATGCTSQASVTGCQASNFTLQPTSPFKNDGPWWGKECVGVNGVACIPPIRTTRQPPPSVPLSYTFSGTITGTITH